MNIICKIRGHKWDESDMYLQNCKRKRCGTFRALYQKKYPKIGEVAVEWEIFEELNFKNI